MAVPNLDIFSAEELAEIQTQAKAEYLERISGKITTGSKNGRSYGLQTMSMADLNMLLDALARKLGFTKAGRVRVNLNPGGYRR